MEEMIELLEETVKQLQNYYQATEKSISYVMERMVTVITYLGVAASEQQKHKLKMIKTEYGRKKKLREETKHFRTNVTLAVRSHHLLGETKPVYFYNLEAILHIWLSTKDNVQRLEDFHNRPIDPAVYDSPKNCQIYQELSITSTEPVILLAIFCDEVTPMGTLNAKNSLFKLFNFYVIVILAGPTQRRLEQIFPLCLIHSADISELGLEQVTRQVAEQFQDVVRHGLSFKGRRYQARVIYVTGDNLGQNQLLGLTLSWRHGKSCRFCHYRMSELPAVASAADFMTGVDRTALEFQETITAAENEEPLQHGFVSMPAFHTIPFFPMHSSTFTLDVDHDFYIGCALHWMVAIINKIVFKLNWLTPSLMIAVWKRMKFVRADARNRPYLKFDLANNTVKVCTKVAHIKILINTFSIVLYPYIRDTHHPVWKFYLYLLHLSRLLQTSNHTETTLEKLDRCIKATLNARISVTRNADGQFVPTVKYKEHNLTHYPFIIRRFGPLCLQSSGIGEQFHQFCKQCYGQSRNSKHLLCTMLRRIDSKIHARANSVPESIKVVVLRKTSKKRSQLDSNSSEFYNNFPPETWVRNFEKNGRRFELGGLVGIPRRDDEDEPRFVKILGIHKDGNNRFLLAVKHLEIEHLPLFGLYKIANSTSRPRSRYWSERLRPIPCYTVSNGTADIEVFSLTDFNLYGK